MNDFLETKNKIVANISESLKKKWQEENTKEIVRDFLLREGSNKAGLKKIDELLEERHRIALESDSDETRLKAITATLDSATEKTTNFNQQINVGKDWFSEVLEDIDTNKN